MCTWAVDNNWVLWYSPHPMRACTFNNLAGMIVYKGVKLNSPKWQFCGSENGQSPHLDHQLERKPIGQGSVHNGRRERGGPEITSLGGTHCGPGHLRKGRLPLVFRKGRAAKWPPTPAIVFPQRPSHHKTERQLRLLGTLSSPGGRKW